MQLPFLKKQNQKQIIAIVVLLFLVTSVLLSVMLGRESKDIRERAAGSNEVDLKFDPASGTKIPGDIFPVAIKLYNNTTRSISIRGAQATINVDSKFTIDPTLVKCEFPFDALPIARVEGQTITLLCVIAIGSNPVSLSPTGVPFASFSLTVRSDATAGNAILSFTSTRVTESGMNGQAPDVSTSGQNASFVINSTNLPSPTSGTVITLTPDPTIVASSYLIPIGSKQPLTVNIGDGTFPSPTPSDQSYIINIGDKQALTINIGEVGPVTPTSIVPTPTLVVPTINPNYPHIRFAVKLFGAERTPEIKVRLKVLDIIRQITPTPIGSIPRDTCVDATDSQHLFADIRMIADSSGVYRPLPGGSFTGHHTSGTDQLTVATDGWIPLVGVTPGRIYSFSVKGPKHRNVRMTTNFVLLSGIPGNQDFDWTGNLLEPGDLPNPNTLNRQDCVVNSIDLSLIETRISATDQANLDIGDVNFDNVVNGNDVAKVVHTLSTKPDDDN